jgi:hypothetical protein
MFATDWFLVLFANTLPSETAARVWDGVFLEGPKVGRRAPARRGGGVGTARGRTVPLLVHADSALTCPPTRPPGPLPALPPPAPKVIHRVALALLSMHQATLMHKDNAGAAAAQICRRAPAHPPVLQRPGPRPCPSP